MEKSTLYAFMINLNRILLYNFTLNPHSSFDSNEQAVQFLLISFITEEIRLEWLTSQVHFNQSTEGRNVGIYQGSAFPILLWELCIKSNLTAS